MMGFLGSFEMYDGVCKALGSIDNAGYHISHIALDFMRPYYKTWGAAR